MRTNLPGSESSAPQMLLGGVSYHLQYINQKQNHATKATKSQTNCVSSFKVSLMDFEARGAFRGHPEDHMETRLPDVQHKQPRFKIFGTALRPRESQNALSILPFDITRRITT